MFKKYRRTNIAEMRPYVIGEILSEYVSISKKDLENGSPKAGDMIARNPKSHKDMWLIAKEYFEDNFEELNDKSKEVTISTLADAHMEERFGSMSKKVDEVFKNETKESLTDWIQEKRKNQTRTGGLGESGPRH